MGLFTGTYLVTEMGEPPIANQLVGVALFAPMLLGTYAAARLRTAADARRLVSGTENALLAATVVMTCLVASDHVHTWMVYPFMLAYGFGGMVNMTAQRELLFCMAGPRHATRVLNAEVTATACAMMLGPLVGGLCIAGFGIGAAFGVLALLLGCSIPLLWISTRRLSTASPVVLSVPTQTAGQRHWRVLRNRGALQVILLVTVICNVCYFAFIPLVPVIARRLDSGPLLAGVVGSTAGSVALGVAAALVVRPLRRPLPAYTLGVALCLSGLLLLACAPLVSVALLALVLAGVGQGLFGSTQATLPVAAVDSHERAVALGLLTTTIGLALPIGMVLLGLTATLLGAQAALTVSALAGLAALGLTALSQRDGQWKGRRLDPLAGATETAPGADPNRRI
ncbi:MFS transporter [Mycobacterium sp. SMC-4]|uniref:MFS transporter n=1 Tax=Mycobacterium sp. SMC-4 TaxID=2857059 RepID=UPI0021B2D500|nr:MFS transporter [Mycobacterium sp. SMC-4]UXA17758.1 MFS transporter [Mycobacterium sp. SMC-4]